MSLITKSFATNLTQNDIFGFSFGSVKDVDVSRYILFARERFGAEPTPVQPFSTMNFVNMKSVFQMGIESLVAVLIGAFVVVVLAMSNSMLVNSGQDIG